MPISLFLRNFASEKKATHKNMKIDKYLFQGYFMLKAYLILLHDSILVRHRYTIGLEKLPKQGEHFFIVCNHQNTANDPLNILFSLPFAYRISALARANVFEVRPWITKFLHWIGLLPAFRLDMEGGAAINNNFQSFDLVAERVHAGIPMVVFPEAGHTQGYYLDPFTTGAVRMAFYAAKKYDFKEDVKIVPSAHHYEDYFKMQSDFLWQIDDPISLKPYYEEYQAHPYRVLRNVTALLRNRIQSMMLDEGVEDYEKKDFLRRSALNPTTTRKLTLPEQLKEDKQFIAQITARPDYKELMDLAGQLKEKEENVGINDQTFVERPNWIKSITLLLLLIVCLPLWIICLWPHAVCYAYPTRLIVSDKMFTNSYRFILSALLLYPLAALLTILILGIVFGWWWQALVWILLWIPTARFGWWYFQKTKQLNRWLHYLSATAEIKEIAALRIRIKNMLESAASK